MLLLGLNKGVEYGLIHGKSENPFKKVPKTGSGGIVFVILLLFILFAVALLCFIRAKKNERDRVVTFAPTTQADAKKTYKNGVEVKPSEINDKKNTAINDSQIENEDLNEQEEQLLDEEEK